MCHLFILFFSGVSWNHIFWRKRYVKSVNCISSEKDIGVLHTGCGIRIQCASWSFSVDYFAWTQPWSGSELCTVLHDHINSDPADPVSVPMWSALGKIWTNETLQVDLVNKLVNFIICMVILYWYIVQFVLRHDLNKKCLILDILVSSGQIWIGELHKRLDLFMNWDISAVSLALGLRIVDPGTR